MSWECSVSENDLYDCLTITRENILQIRISNHLVDICMVIQGLKLYNMHNTFMRLTDVSICVVARGVIPLPRVSLQIYFTTCLNLGK